MVQSIGIILSRKQQIDVPALASLRNATKGMNPVKLVIADDLLYFRESLVRFPLSEKPMSWG